MNRRIRLGGRFRGLPKRAFRCRAIFPPERRSAVHFAQGMPHLMWQPSDPDPELRASIRAWITQSGLSNVHAPLDLDIGRLPWPIEAADAVVCINMIHIAPWPATPALMAGTARVLSATGVLVLYGPYRREGQHTAPSNEAFDQQLRAKQVWSGWPTDAGRGSVP